MRAACAALLATACAAVPVTAHADLTIINGLTGSSVCQFSSASVTLGSPVQAAPNTGVAVSGTTLDISGAGTCTGLNGPVAFSLIGHGQTIGSPICASITAIGAGTVTLGSSYPIAFALAGPAAAELIGMLPSSPLQGGGAAAALLSITPASLQACLQPGGTTSIQYTGAVVIVT
ncbi:MAG TPA: hypothetical protein VN193_02245 [Candidatus Angelobacter sp.]|jgi:hypothetical protein|nr:hypothetical protein [Candidatus Angelobacter sp.]